MNRKPLAAFVAASSFVAFAGLASAQSSQPASRDTGRTASGVEFTTGGVGITARQQLAEQAGRYNTRIEFAFGPEGEFLAGVDVEISDARGNTVLSTTTDGPWLLAKLPSGRYTVKASFGGVTRTQQINVGGGTNRVVVSFPASVEQQGVAGSSPRTPSMAYSR